MVLRQPCREALPGSRRDAALWNVSEDWRTEGEVLGDDGRTVVASITGSDAYEAPGPTVVHYVDVEIAGDRTRALEIAPSGEAGDSTCDRLEPAGRQVGRVGVRSVAAVGGRRSRCRGPEAGWGG